jgi:hypothetical protein
MSDKPKIEELKLHLDGLGSTGVSCLKDPCPFCEAIRSILTDHERVKAALRDQEIADGYSVSALQAELAQVKAERDEWKNLYQRANEDYCSAQIAIRDLKARLALAEPLLKAVAGGDVGGEEWPYEVMKQAQAYRQALEAKPKGEKGEEDGK